MQDARNKRYAVGLFNATDSDMLQATVDAAEEMGSPIIIGTAHGAYKSTPKLDIQRLREIRSAVDVPLVLHGGSGLPDSDFRNCIENRISKVNIFTDICIAGNEAIKKVINTDMHYLEIRNKKVEAMKHEVKQLCQYPNTPKSSKIAVFHRCRS